MAGAAASALSEVERQCAVLLQRFVVVSVEVGDLCFELVEAVVVGLGGHAGGVTSTYGSDEYKQFLVGMGEGLNHHYANNDHHPEHWQHGIADMDLIQVIEMLADWKAATLRHENGSLSRSIAQNAERFEYGVV